ncbi:MAG: type I-C CRISPR-associated protein Cas7/Csd2 [Thermodesulfovibrionales bacterium]
MTALNNRYDFVLLFDVKDGNPNGDPDAGNLPRLDPETGHGLVTDVCLKRKVRNYVDLIKGGAESYDIYVRERAVLNRLHEEGFKAKGKEPSNKESKEVKDWMCHRYYDIRTFGAVMTTEVNCGQVRGPVQLTFSRSVDQAVPLEHSITRMAVTNERDLEKERTMGRKFTIPYALYRCHGFVSAPLAAQTGFSEEDLALFWDALKNMFEHDRSAARGEMATRKLVVFKHEGAYGNAPAHMLFERVTVSRKDAGKPPRSFEDYEVTLKMDGLPSGLTMMEMV